MFGPLGFPEMLFIVVLALLIFGPKRLPEVGRTIGKGMAQFRKATSDLKRTIETEIALDEQPPRPAARPSPSASQPRRIGSERPEGPESAAAPIAAAEPPPASEGSATTASPGVESAPGESRPA